MKKLFVLSLLLPLSMSLCACGKSDAQKREACNAILTKAVKENYKPSTAEDKLLGDPACLTAHPDDSALESAQKKHKAWNTSTLFNEPQPNNKQ